MLSAWGDEHAERRGRGRTSALCTPGRRRRPGRPASARRSSPAARSRYVASSTGARHSTTGAAQRSRCDAPDRSPIGVVGISVWGRPLPEHAGVWLADAASGVGRRLRAARRRSRAARRNRPRSPRARRRRIAGRRAGRTILCRSTRCTWSNSRTASCGSARRRAASAPRPAQPRRARGTARACGLPSGEPHRDREPAPGARDRSVVQGRRVGGDRRRGVGGGVEAARAGASRPPSRPPLRRAPASGPKSDRRDAGSTARRPQRFRDAPLAR